MKQTKKEIWLEDRFIIPMEFTPSFGRFGKIFACAFEGLDFISKEK